MKNLEEYPKLSKKSLGPVTEHQLGLSNAKIAMYQS